MRTINPAKAAVSVGAAVGLYHLMWTVLVGVGAAKAILDFVLRLHFLALTYELAPFDAPTAAILVSLTFATGAAFGLIFALIWNWLTRRSASQETQRRREGEAVA